MDIQNMLSIGEQIVADTLKRKEMIELLSSAINRIEYTLATLNPATQDATTAQWAKIHKGRARSSYSQLSTLQKRMRKMIADIENDNHPIT